MNDYFSILKPLENRIRMIKASVNYIVIFYSILLINQIFNFGVILEFEWQRSKTDSAEDLSDQKQAIFDGSLWCEYTNSNNWFLDGMNLSVSKQPFS